MVCPLFLCQCSTYIASARVHVHLLSASVDRVFYHPLLSGNAENVCVCVCVCACVRACACVHVCVCV